MPKKAPELLMRRFNPKQAQRTIGESDEVTIMLKASSVACLIDVLENESKPQPGERDTIVRALRDAVTRWHSK